MSTPDTTSRKLIDRLVPDSKWGSMQGLLCTTYDLDPDFLELDFLPSVFGLGARSQWATRISIERHLSELDLRAMILTEARRYRGRPRSLQLEVIPAFSQHRSALHAKVTVLVYDRAVRMIVGSANLTERSYRRNREAVVVLTASRESPEHAAIISQGLNEAERILSSWLTEDARKLIRHAQTMLQPWIRNGSNGSINFCWSGNEFRLWRTFLERWSSEDLITRVSILSPFWSEDAGITLKAFLTQMNQLGILAANAEVRLLTDAYERTDGSVLPILPAGYTAHDWSSLGVKVTASAVNPKVHPAEVGGMESFAGKRDLHAKIVILEGSSDALVYVGSANFTVHGWGFLKNRADTNIEAGLIFRCSRRSAILQSVIPEVAGSPVPLTDENLHVLVAPENVSGDAPWPDFVISVVLSPAAQNDNELELVIQVDRSNAPEAWSAKLAEKQPLSAEILLQVTADDQFCADKFVISLSPEMLTRLLIEQEVWICWGECPSGRAVPLNVDSSARDRLPVSPNQRLNESDLISYYQGKLSWEQLFPDLENPFERTLIISESPTEVDKSKIQSYQIREFVEALAGIRDDLKGATRSERAMRLALYGPVSPLSLASTIMQAVNSGLRSPMAAAFQFTELLACLNSVSYFTVPDKLCGAWKQHLAYTSSRIARLLKQLPSRDPEAFSHTHAFRLYKKTVLHARVGSRT